MPNALTDLLRLPDVQESTRNARKACEELRWHPALRRRIPEAAAESRVRGAVASASLEGAEIAGSRLSLPLVRDVMRGAQKPPATLDPMWRTMMAAIQATAAGERITQRSLGSPMQVLAGLHVAAAAGLLPAAQVGRPRLPDEDCVEWVELAPAPTGNAMRERLSGVADLMKSVPGGSVSAVVLAGLIHAEIIATRPFVAGNALVARSLERVVLQQAGLDPTGIAVVEAGHAVGVGASYRGALTAYVEGGQRGVGLWLVHCAEAVTHGAIVGNEIADAVLAGRLT